MKFTKNIGMLLLAVYLIVDGLLGFGLHLGPWIFPVVHCGTSRRCLYSHRQIARPGRFLTKGFGQLSEQFHHLGGQFRANPSFFMFEVDKNIVPAAMLLPNEFHPAFDVDLVVIFAT